MIKPQDFNFWIKNDLNVLFRGKHGVGKTAQIIQAFEANGLKFQYFSAATMDPWVDFIGVPKEKVDEKGNSYLDLVRPKHFQEDEVQAIFLDEFNRASKKVRNAVMELIQFKSINGKKFNNLKIVWAAINPEDDKEDKYDVEELDPAQLDRFHVIIDVPYKPDAGYFRMKYKELGESAVIWWKELETKQQNLISPRRLDYALDIFQRGGDIRHVFPKEVNTARFINELKQGPFACQLAKLHKDLNDSAARVFLSNENNFNGCVQIIVKNDNYIQYFVPLMEKEKIVGLMTQYKAIEKIVFDDYNKSSKSRPSQFQQLMLDLAQNTTSKLGAKAAKAVANMNKKLGIGQQPLNFNQSANHTTSLANCPACAGIDANCYFCKGTGVMGGITPSANPSTNNIALNPIPPKTPHYLKLNPNAVLVDAQTLIQRGFNEVASLKDLNENISKTGLLVSCYSTGVISVNQSRAINNKHKQTLFQTLKCNFVNLDNLSKDEFRKNKHIINNILANLVFILDTSTQPNLNNNFVGIMEYTNYIINIFHKHNLVFLACPSTEVNMVAMRKPGFIYTLQSKK